MPITSSSSSPFPRTPNFLAQVRGKVGHAAFGVGGPGQVMPFFEQRGGPAAPAEVPAMGPPAGMEPLAPPLPPPMPQPGPEFAERLARAVAELRGTGERLGEQASADALEMALLIARRIIETELTANPEALLALIRSAIRRLGESRRVQLRLCPADAAAVEAAGGSAAGGPLDGLSLARVEVRADATLLPGDCIVDGEQGTVDGRVTTRLDEVRRCLSRALSEEAVGTP
jgi:hypothetical protein